LALLRLGYLAAFRGGGASPTNAPLWAKPGGRGAHATENQRVDQREFVAEKCAAFGGSVAGLIFRVLVTSAGFRCTILYRLSYALRHRVPLFGTPLSKVLFWISRHWYGCSIAGTARIAGGLVMPHPHGIVIGAGVSINERPWIYQNVTIGGAPHKIGLPSIGSDARIYPGAVIAGPVRIGNDVWIGANTVVQHDVPDATIVRAADAIHIVQKRPEES
jgi:serine O-acetyltransferase